MEFKTVKSECRNLDDIVGNGMSIQRRFIFNKKQRIITIRVLRKVGYSWQNTGLDVDINIDEQKVYTAERGLVLEW